MSGEPVFFATPAAFRRWLHRHHATATELLDGFYRKDSGRKSITYPEALDEALCYGWIDGVRRRLDADSYVQRFTPRTKRSIWSAINIGHVERLTREGRMAPAGVRAFEGRDPKRAQEYSYERATCALEPAQEQTFRKNRGAWAFFSAQPPSYRRVACWYVIGAKRPETRERRLRQLIDDSARGRRLRGFPQPKATAQRG